MVFHVTDENRNIELWGRVDWDQLWGRVDWDQLAPVNLQLLRLRRKLWKKSFAAAVARRFVDGFHFCCALTDRADDHSNSSQ